MKKVLLSLSLLAATVFAANAQQVLIWDSNAGATGVSGMGSAFKFDNLSVDTATTAPHLIHAHGTALSNCGASSNGPCYYIGGFANGSYASPNVGLPWGITATDLSQYFFTFYVKSPSPGANIKIMFNSKDSATTVAGVKTYLDQGYLLNLTTSYTALTKVSVPLSAFSNCIGENTNPNGVSFMTKEFAAGIFQIKITVNVGDNSSGVGPADVYFGDLFLSSSKTLGTSAAAANIGSSALYPNPTSGQVNANLTLVNPASVSMIVTDMVGKQIATKNFGTVSTLQGVEVFDSSALAKGMYTVTYVLDGTPAKTELVVVK